MYAYISGTVVSAGQDFAVIDNRGIGYRIFMPASEAEALEAGEEVKLFTHFSVREDAMLLYGFLTEEDLELFRLLIGVNGVGPRGAMGILSVLDGDELRFAVLTEDASSIARAPGIGRKTAQKVILELKDKLDLEDAFEKKSLKAGKDSSGKEGPGADAVMGLTICNATRERQEEALRLAEASDIMIVIGGRNSSNTQKLVDICRSSCPETLFVQSGRDLDSVHIRPDSCVGITAGASTPNTIIQEVSQHVRRAEL